MDSLPQELIDRISSFLGRGDLKGTLYVSHGFQAAAERFSGAFSKYEFWKNITNDVDVRLKSMKDWDSIDDDSTRFIETYGGRRLRYLRFVEVHTGLPHQYSRQTRCRETEEDLRAKDEFFTKQIRLVFSAIKSAQDRATRNGFGIGKIQLTVRTPIRWVFTKVCNHQVFSSWRLRLLSPETLPRLACIRGLSVCNPEWLSDNEFPPRPSRTRMSLRVLIDLATRLPNLEYLGCELGIGEWRSTNENPARRHFEWDFEACQRDSRNGLAEGLAMAIENDALPSSLRHVQLDFVPDLYEHLQEQRGSGPNLVDPMPYDLLSSSLRKFSYHLRRLELRIHGDKTLFLPTDKDVTCWPSLENLSIMVHPLAPDGSWYFRGPSGEGHDDFGYPVTDAMYPPHVDNQNDDLRWHNEHIPGAVNLTAPRFRVVPNDRTLVPLLESLAKASCQMYALKQAILWFPLDFDARNLELDNAVDPQYQNKFGAGLLAWGIIYECPEVESPVFLSPMINRCSKRQLWWTVGDWRPKHDLHKLFQDIGSSKYGGELLEHWGHDIYGDALVDAELFAYDSFVFGVRQISYPPMFGTDLLSKED